jgi:hypothetical protein
MAFRNECVGRSVEWPRYWYGWVRISVPCLGGLVPGILPLRTGFDTIPVRVEFVVDKVALGQAFPCRYHSASVPSYPFVYLPPTIYDLGSTALLIEVIKSDADCVEHVIRRCFALEQGQDFKPTSACSVSPPKISWRAVAGRGSEYR